MEKLEINKIFAKEYVYEQCRRSDHPKHRHACIIIYNGRIVAVSNNTRSQHAEPRALYIARICTHKRIRSYTLISLAINKKGEMKLAKPCKACLRYMEGKGVKEVWYSTNEQIIRRLK